jgi:hypothetical protein
MFVPDVVGFTANTIENSSIASLALESIDLF